MNISNLDNTPISIPSQRAYDCDDCNKVFEESDSNDDGVLTANELGAAASVNISVVANEQIETQKLQDEFLYNLAELKNGNINKEEFNDFLEKRNINNFVQEEVNSIDNQTQINTNNNLNLASVLFNITKESSSLNDEQSLSSYANTMQKINEQTQGSDIKDKLQVYIDNLKN